ncbi:hypothetical protein PGB28_05825 [Primorskyibacter aestuariivivens]|uniref:hypothetical protein n=1 Tax=Primorskyibacter aestuariivivens TaxID=1888912 RepID=UPI002300B876|nr:hypothetical protein [Primorskyibacter aestuariivivens]MDA7427968.1 hypothetical protein [Primorskyibacter aestuariivivens]
MTTHDRKAERDDAFLDALFDEEKAARNAAPEVSLQLMARILADAEAVQDGFAPPPAQAPRPKRPGYFRQISTALGGWPAFAGLATASVCGLWLGVNPPEGLSDMASLYVTGGETLLDPISGFDLDLGEG